VGALTGVATVLSGTVIALTVNFEDIPHVVPRERIELAKLAEGVLANHRALWLHPGARHSRRLETGERLRVSDRS
jgi:hypothetical protein